MNQAEHFFEEIMTISPSLQSNGNILLQILILDYLKKHNFESYQELVKESYLDESKYYSISGLLNVFTL